MAEPPAAEVLEGFLEQQHVAEDASVDLADAAQRPRPSVMSFELDLAQLVGLAAVDDDAARIDDARERQPGHVPIRIELEPGGVLVAGDDRSALQVFEDVLVQHASRTPVFVLERNEPLKVTTCLGHAFRRCVVTVVRQRSSLRWALLATELPLDHVEVSTANDFRIFGFSVHGFAPRLRGVAPLARFRTSARETVRDHGAAERCRGWREQDHGGAQRSFSRNGTMKPIFFRISAAQPTGSLQISEPVYRSTR